MSSLDENPFMVLVIEDDYDQMELWRDFLSRTRTVLTATSVEEAVAVYQAHHEQITAVLADARLGMRSFADVLAAWDGIVRPFPPIALLTARPQYHPEVIAIQKWIDGKTPFDYFQKPTSLRLILDWLDNVPTNRP